MAFFQNRHGPFILLQMAHSVTINAFGGVRKADLIRWRVADNECPQC